MHYAQNDPRWLAAHGTTIKIQVLYNQHLTLAPYGLALFAPAGLVGAHFQLPAYFAFVSTFVLSLES